MKKNMVHAKCPKCKAEQNQYKDRDIWHKCLYFLHTNRASYQTWTCKFCGEKMEIRGSETIRYSARKVKGEKSDT